MHNLTTEQRYAAVKRDREEAVKKIEQADSELTKLQSRKDAETIKRIDLLVSQLGATHDICYVKINAWYVVPICLLVVLPIFAFEHFVRVGGF